MRRALIAALLAAIASAAVFVPGALAAKPGVTFTAISLSGTGGTGSTCSFDMTVSYTGKAPNGASLGGTLSTPGMGFGLDRQTLQESGHTYAFSINTSGTTPGNKSYSLYVYAWAKNNKLLDQVHTSTTFLWPSSGCPTGSLLSWP